MQLMFIASNGVNAVNDLILCALGETVDWLKISLAIGKIVASFFGWKIVWHYKSEEDHILLSVNRQSGTTLSCYIQQF